MIQKKALVCGAGGFIGHHIVRKLVQEGYWVRGADVKYPLYSTTDADEFLLCDLRDPAVCAKVLDVPFDEVYQLAADMGGAGYIFTGDHDADVLHNSALINLNIATCAVQARVKKVLYSSSACIYPVYNQRDPDHPTCAEDSVYPASPDSEYGWEKIFSERLYLAYMRNYGLDVRIARFHNVFGPQGAWNDGREKVPAAICRKIAQAEDGGDIEIWGDGHQTRSFLYIDECLEGVRRLMDAADFHGPVNIGSTEMVTINHLVDMVMKISGKKLTVHHIDGPVGVKGRNSDNRLICKKLRWEPTRPLYDGLVLTYQWIEQQVRDTTT